MPVSIIKNKVNVATGASYSRARFRSNRHRPMEINLRVLHRCGGARTEEWNIMNAVCSIRIILKNDIATIGKNIHSGTREVRTNAATTGCRT